MAHVGQKFMPKEPDATAQKPSFPLQLGKQKQNRKKKIWYHLYYLKCVDMDSIISTFLDMGGQMGDVISLFDFFKYE